MTSSKLIGLLNRCKQHGILFRKVRMGSRTLRRFLREHPTGSFYLRKRGHALAVIDGQVSDTTPQASIILDAWQCVTGAPDKMLDNAKTSIQNINCSTPSRQP